MSIDDLVSVKCQKRSAHQTTPPKGSWVQKCKRVWKAKPTSRGLSVKCPCPQRNRPPRQTAVESKHAKGFKLPRLHLMACANHEARRLPLRFFHFFCVGGSAPHIICLPLMHSILPKRAARFSSSCSPSALGTGLPSYATNHLLPSTTSSMINMRSPACVVLGGSMHTYMRWAPTKVNLYCHTCSTPLANRLAVPMKIVSGATTTSAMAAKANSLPGNENKVEPTVLAAVRRCSAPNKAKNNRMLSTRCSLLSTSMCAYTHVTYQSCLLPPAYLTQTYHPQHDAKASLQTLFLQHTTEQM